MNPKLYKKREAAWRRFSEWEESYVEKGAGFAKTLRWYGETVSWLVKSDLMDPNMADPQKTERICQFHKVFARLSFKC